MTIEFKEKFDCRSYLESKGFRFKTRGWKGDDIYCDDVRIEFQESVIRLFPRFTGDIGKSTNIANILDSKKKDLIIEINNSEIFDENYYSIIDNNGNLQLGHKIIDQLGISYNIFLNDPKFISIYYPPTFFSKKLEKLANSAARKITELGLNFKVSVIKISYGD